MKLGSCFVNCPVGRKPKGHHKLEGLARDVLILRTTAVVKERILYRSRLFYTLTRDGNFNGCSKAGSEPTA